ncbi:uncharacterized protein LOC142468496 isoform X2 [Ascaphus truei]|uniref:uncharacterized protein LOC142468496 isoform X2 n=1 Tax=Ascaphus truei TaxID=8439 RepID=UPI003F591C5D
MRRVRRPIRRMRGGQYRLLRVRGAAWNFEEDKLKAKQKRMAMTEKKPAPAQSGVYVRGPRDWIVRGLQSTLSAPGKEKLRCYKRSRSGDDLRNKGETQTLPRHWSCSHAVSTVQMLRKLKVPEHISLGYSVSRAPAFNSYLCPSPCTHTAEISRGSVPAHHYRLSVIPTSASAQREVAPKAEFQRSREEMAASDPAHGRLRHHTRSIPSRVDSTAARNSGRSRFHRDLSRSLLDEQGRPQGKDTRVCERPSQP